MLKPQSHDIATTFENELGYCNSEKDHMRANHDKFTAEDTGASEERPRYHTSPAS